MTNNNDVPHNNEDMADVEKNGTELDEAENRETDLQDEVAIKESEDDTEADSKEEVESEDARYMRLAADFQNFKRRVQKEKNDIYSYANEKIALDIIDVMDNFERALQHSDDSESPKFFEGVELIYKQLKGALDKNNILEIESDGAVFDPNFHNAVMMEKNDAFKSNTVIRTMQKGYTLNGKVIRPSMVTVSQ